MQNILEVIDLHTRYTTFERTIRAVDGVSFTIGEGETLGIVGETGTGKSVLVNSVMGLIQHPGEILKGQVIYRGTDLLGLDSEQLRHIRGKEITLIPSHARQRLNPLMPVGRQIANVIQAHHQVSKKAALAQAAELVKTVGIVDPGRRMHAYPHELSGGMAQRIIIAIALAPGPKLLITDEPTMGLDVTVQVQILDLIAELSQKTGTATMIVSRDLGIIAHYCHRVAVMKAGRMVEQAEVNQFFSQPRHEYSRYLLQSANMERN